MRDELDDCGEWIEALTVEHRTLSSPGRQLRELDLLLLVGVAHDLALAHEEMADLYRRHIRALEDNDDGH